MALRLKDWRVCAYGPCGVPFRPWQSDQRFHTITCGNLNRWSGREKTKRACHYEARKSLQDHCEGLKPSGRPCNRVRGLHVHHRDGNFRNNDPANHQTLCPACHIRAHGKKTWRENNRRLKAA